MIESVRIANFKSYRNATLQLSPLTLLVGANASGKSNALEAIRLLGWLSSGARLDMIGRTVQGGDTEFRGKVTDLFLDPSQPLELSVTLHNDSPWRHFTISLALRDELLRLEQETIDSDAQTFPLYRVERVADGLSHDLEVAYNNFAKGGKKPRIKATDQQAILTQLETPARFDKTHKRAQSVIPERVALMRAVLGNTQFLDPEPSRMRGYADTIGRMLEADGKNLSGVLYNLCKDDKTREQVLRFIRSLPEQDIVEIGFLETPRKEVMLTLTETFSGSEVDRDATVLSDGTLRVLAVAAAVLSAPQGSLLVIEEIDNGIHPSRAGQVLKSLQETANDRDVSIIISSHNPALLDSLPEQAVPNVVFCYRDPVGGDSKLIRLKELRDYPELIAQGPLGTLMTKGIIENYVKRPKGPEQRRKEAEAMLKLFA